MSRDLYPRPELVRDNWINLNGEWEFEFDFGKSALDRKLYEKDHLDKTIIVPFCPESELSGINYKDFFNACAYKKVVELNKGSDHRIILNFEAAYYNTTVLVNEKMVGKHSGGYTPFNFDITDYTKDGENTIFVVCDGDSRDLHQPSGKQCSKYYSSGCSYTRTTGIYAPVWIEYVPNVYLSSLKIDTDIDNSKIDISVGINGCGNKTITINAFCGDELVGSSTLKSSLCKVNSSIYLSKLCLWDLDNPFLYDLTIEIKSDNSTDFIKSYFGMRKVELDKYCLKLNNKRVFQKLVLDQGYNPKGIYTFENDEDFKRDILLSKNFGFNGARLHQRVFERRFLYECDKLGYLVWDEYPNWGFDYTTDWALSIYQKEWIDVINRDYNHPSIIVWCPFNETWNIEKCRLVSKDLLRQIYNQTKLLDPFRPCVDTSGNYHVVTDIYDIHDYNQDVETMTKRYGSLKYDTPNEEVFTNLEARQKYEGQPYMVSEYGGIKWSKENSDGWGYGNAPKTIDEFINRYCGIAKALIDSERVCGLVYTQLYDVEQEQNGLYYYDRTSKFDENKIALMRDAMNAKAKIEKE